tara:strand:- start:129 stop:461 length:333 start_codon:yes stop_codon:yes gene_type:complete
LSRKSLPRSENENPRREWRDMVLGLLSSAMLTIASFAVAIFKPMGSGWLLAVLGMLAVIQIAVQFRFFLHVDLDKSHRDDLQLVLFTGLVVGLMVCGSLWILFDQHARMG